MSANIRSTTSMALTASTANIVLNKPAGTKDGDLLIAAVASFGNTSQSVTPPSGWVLVRSSLISTTDVLFVYQKIASSEPSSWTWTMGAGTGVVGGVAFAIIDYDATTPIDSSAAATAAGTQTPSYANTITPTRDTSLLLMFVSPGSGGLNVTGISGYAITTTNPTWTELYELDFNNGSSTFALGIATAFRTAITATGNSSAVIAGPGTPYGSSCIILSVKRTLAYQVIAADTQVVTDANTIKRNRVANAIETQVLSDKGTASRTKVFKNQAKHAATDITNIHKT